MTEKSEQNKLRVWIREDKSLTCKVIIDGKFHRLNLMPGETLRYGNEKYDYSEIIKNWDNPNRDFEIVRRSLDDKECDKNNKQTIAYILLKNTDYILQKYIEEVEIYQNITKERFLEKYKKIFENRKKAREVLAELPSKE